MRRWLALALLCAAVSAYAGTDAPAVVDALPQGPSPRERLVEIRRRVQAATTYPTRARELGLEGTARIQFEVGPDGIAQAVETIESSGHRLLDRAAEQGAVAAGRLPPLYGRIRIPVRFRLSGSD